MENKNTKQVPNAIKWLYTAFMAVLVPVYAANYGPTNFLYFCDLALFLTLFAVWRNNALAVSMCAVGILIPQVFWCIDFVAELAGFHLTHMTSYMFDSTKSQFLRGLSLFHGWLPFLILYLVYLLGYDKRALAAWTGLACGACLAAFYLFPPAGAVLADPNTPRNINYVFGMNDATPQTYMDPHLYLIVWIIGLFVAFYVPTHLFMKKFFTRGATKNGN